MPVQIPDELERLHNVHAERLRPMLDSDRKRATSIPAGMKFIFICYTNRSGSNLVAELLASSGFFNLAGEFFNFDTVNHHAERLGLETFYDYFVHLCRHISKNGTLVCKLSATHLVLLNRSGILEDIVGRSRFILAERGDRLSQAISLAIASQTGQWTSRMPAHISAGDLQFDKRQIDSIIHSTVKQQSLLEVFFALNGIQYFKLMYEQFSANPEVYIPSLYEWLAVEAPPIQTKKVKIERQATSINADWRDLYLLSA